MRLAVPLTSINSLPTTANSLMYRNTYTYSETYLHALVGKGLMNRNTYTYRCLHVLVGKGLTNRNTYTYSETYLHALDQHFQLALLLKNIKNENRCRGGTMPKTSETS